MSEDVEEEITLPGVIRGDGGAPREGAGAGAPREGLRRIGIGEGINTEAETASEDEDVCASYHKLATLKILSVVSWKT